MGTCVACNDPFCRECVYSIDTDQGAGLICASCAAEWRAASAGPATLGELKAGIRPSPIFLVIVAVFVAACAWTWTLGKDVSEGEARWGIRAVVFAGWGLSLCLHEFGHASTAYVGGDRTVASKGYLTLDPRKYAHVGLSLALPVVFLLIGGIGLPGGAVWINQGLIRSAKMRSLMSFAGPLANFICAAVLAIPFAFGVVESAPVLALGLAFLAALQIATGLLNLLPMPGLDGFGVLEPFLPRSIIEALAPVRQFGFFILFLVLFRTGLGDLLFDTSDRITDFLGVPVEVADLGRRLFSFSIF
jgi:Zn-dependent protease